MNLKNAWKMLPLSGVAAFCLLASCSSTDYEGIVSAIIISQDQTAVTADFELPKTTQEHNIEWSSSDDSVIKTYEKDETLMAGVIRPTESKTITLTAKIDKASKDFTIRVNPVDVYEIADNYKLAEAGSLVYDKEITLPSTYTYKYQSGASDTAQEFTANISWESSNPSLVKIEDGKAKVGQSDEKVQVKLNATFTYNSVNSRYSYNLSVWKMLNPTEYLQYWYDNPGNGENFAFNGYVLSKFGYSEKYGNGNLYVMNEDKTGTYYVYRASMTKEEFDGLKLGDPVAVSECPSTTYKGLIESSKAVVKPIDYTVPTNLQPIDVAALVPTPVDNEFITQNKELVYYQNTYASLTGWKITKMGSASATGTSTTQTMLTLEKNGFETTVAINKDIVPLDSTAATTLFETVRGLKVGDFVDIKGFVSVYNDYQMLVTGADSITKATAEGDATVSKTIKDEYKLLDGINLAYVQDATVNLPEATKGEFTYSLKRTSYKSVTLSGNTLTVTPKETAESCILIATYKYTDATTSRTYTLTKEITLSIRLLSDLGIATEEANAVFADYENISIDQAIELNATGKTYEGVTLTYTLKAGNTVAAIVNGKLIVVPTATATEVKVEVVATKGEATYTHEYTLNVDLDYASHADYLEAAKGTAITAETEIVTVKGVATGVYPKGARIYLQDLEDSTKGYYGYFGTTDVKVGDVIYVTGRAYTQSSGVISFRNETNINIDYPTVYHAYNLNGTVVTQAVDELNMNEFLADATKTLEASMIGVKAKVTGTVTEANDNNGDINYTIKTSTDKTVVYRADDGAVDTETFTAITSKLFIGAQVTISGSIGWFNGAQVYIFSVNDIVLEETEANVKKSVESAIAAVLPAEVTESGTATLPTTTKAFAGAITYTLSENTLASIAEGVLTYNIPTQADTKVTLTATWTKGETVYTVTYEVTLKKAASENDPVTSPVLFTTTKTDTGTANAPVDTNVAQLFGLPSIFTVYAGIGACANNVGYTSSDVGIYSERNSGNGCSISVSIAEGYKITKIIFKDASYKNNNDNLGSFTVNNETGSITTSEYTINSTSFVIKNTSKGGTKNPQLRFSGIEIHFETVTE